MIQHPAVHLRSAVSIALVLTASVFAPSDSRANGASLTPEQRRVVASEAMQSAHPDFRWFHSGMRELERNRADLAIVQFTRAARYASKPAQAMLAEMLWEGRGVEPNRAQAYAWMDLAAERDYVVFVAHREKYWHALSPQEREQALEFGRGLYAEYGDDTAQPRLEQRIKKDLRKMTGGRTGHRGHAVKVYQAPDYSPTGSVISYGKLYVGSELNDYYHARYWKPTEYWQWQDEIYTEIPHQWRVGAVEVGEVEPQRQPEED